MIRRGGRPGPNREDGLLIRNIWVRWSLGIAIALLVTVVPFIYYRISYTYQKRFRVVTPGVLPQRLHDRGGLGNHDQDVPHSHRDQLDGRIADPVLHPHYFAPASVKESAVVTNCNARYVAMTVEYLPATARCSNSRRPLIATSRSSTTRAATPCSFIAKRDCTARAS